MTRGRKPHLTDDQAAEAREMYSGPWTVRNIAHYFETTPAVINAALNRTGAYADKPKSRWSSPKIFEQTQTEESQNG